jgi:1,2-diacylglycerol 3-alpha-glucosyltransferase
MRILFVTATYLPTVNGVSSHIFATAQILRKFGHDVYILAPTFPGYTDVDNKVYRYPSLPNPLIKRYPVGIPLVPFETIRKIGPEIIHTHHPFIFGKYASQIARKNGCPLFTTAHTQYEKYMQYYIPQIGRITSKIVNNDLKKLARESKKIICPSVSTERRLNKAGVKNTIVINNGVEEAFFVRPSKKSVREPTLVYAGRLEREKNPIQLLKIAGELKMWMPNFKLIIAGAGLMQDAMFEYSTKHGLENNICFLGEIDRHLFPGIYKSAHLFLTTSVSEVMPMSVLEAMASGVPIVAPKNSGLEELVIDGKTGIAINENTKSAAGKIRELFNNPTALFSLSKSTYKYARNFSVEITAKKLLSAYSG